MDIRLTRTGEYAVRAAIALAAAYPGLRKIREVSQEASLPASYTPHVLKMLATAGLADARAGRAGGYRLSRAPKEVSLLEVVEAVEGPIGNDRCTLRGSACTPLLPCEVHPAWADLRAELRSSLSRWTVGALAEPGRFLARVPAAPARK